MSDAQVKKTFIYTALAAGAVGLGYLVWKSSKKSQGASPVPTPGLSTLNGRPYLQKVACDGSDKSLCELVSKIVPHMPDPSKLLVSQVRGGITNSLSKVELGPGAGTAGPPVLVRVFGAEGLIDRHLENPTFEAIADAFKCPLYYGRFANGRVEGFIEGARPLRMEPLDMAQADISKRIAQKMSQLHKLDLPPALQPFYQEASVWQQLWTFYEGAAKEATATCIGSFSRKDTALEPRSGAEMLSELNLPAAKGILEGLQSKTPSTFPVAFCHNDLLAGNIMVNDASGEVTLIDFEYGGLNFRGFDIANHFNEWAGGTDDGHPDYSKYPSAQQRRAFCSAYLQDFHGRDPSSAELEQLLCEADLFEQVNHWYWGLWAVNMARDEGCSEFPYLTYAQKRIGRFVELSAR